MRRLLNFSCDGDALTATLDEAGGTIGLLIVSGGNEIRIGAHRGMAKLAADAAAAGHPALRFDRRGIGDSEGTNEGFTSSGPDISAAIAAFKRECPNMTRLICFGNCDAATALVLNDVAADELLLANPWVIEPTDDLPPPAAIKAHYRQRLHDPKAWLGLLTGAINIRKALTGLRKMAQPPRASSLAGAFAKGLVRLQHRSTKITILLAARDSTAIAFADEWGGAAFDAIDKSAITLITLDSASHSFASEADYAYLKATILNDLST